MLMAILWPYPVLNDAINKALENINSGLGGEYVSISDNGQLSLNIGEE